MLVTGGGVLEWMAVTWYHCTTHAAVAAALCAVFSVALRACSRVQPQAAADAPRMSYSELKQMPPPAAINDDK